MNVPALINNLCVTVIAGHVLEAKALEHHERRTAGRFCRKTLSVHAVQRKPGPEFLARLKVNYARANPPSVRIVVTPIENTNDKMGTDRETNFTRT